MKNLIIIVSILSFFITMPIVFEKKPLEKEENIEIAFKNGNSAQLAKHFNSNVKLELPNRNKIYSSRQAELILADFFSKNTPKDYTFQSERESISGKNVFGKLETANQTFRVVYSISDNSDELIINSLKLEKETP